MNQNNYNQSIKFPVGKKAEYYSADRYGQLPPQAIEVEEAVLGAMIIEADAVIENRIMPAWFYKEEHQKIATEVIALANEGKRSDLITVISRLRDRGILDEIGGPLKITQLIRNVASAANIEQHLHIIQDKYIRREIIRLSYEVEAMSYDESNDVEDVLGKLHNSTLGVMEFSADSIRDMKYATNMLMDRVVKNETAKIMTGIPTGFRQLDKFTGGWQGTDLVVVAGETSQGKTSLVMNFALNASVAGYRGVIYSLEMSLMQLTARLVSSYAKVSSKRILFEPLIGDEMEKVTTGVFKLRDLPLYTDDNVNNGIDSICLSIRRMKLKYGVHFAIVDYIQNVKISGRADEEATLATVAKALKNLAKELDITIFAVSQLSRNKDKPQPTINRLRGSGQIEETADIILLVYRPEYYNIRTFPEPFENEYIDGRAMITIAKGRNIGTGAMLAEFDKTTTTFSDLNTQPHEQSYPAF
jgi:replicative DNA helicase